MLSIVPDINSSIFPVERHRRRFILKLARSLISLGAPSHRIETQLGAAAKAFSLDASFINLGTVIIIHFFSRDNGRSITHIVRCRAGLSLSGLEDAHAVYRDAVQSKISAEEGCILLNQIYNAKPVHGAKARVLIAYLCGATICPLAFGGSFLDAAVSGCCSGVLAILHVFVADKNAVVGNIFE